MKSFNEFVSIHKRLVPLDRQRLGQRFVNAFIKQPWPELFYEQNTLTAGILILEWLQDNHHFDELPVCLNPIVLGEKD